MEITVSAPGKLVLIGEYAVLFGHPAAVIAVDRRATVDLAPSPDGRFSVAAPGFASARASFDLGADGHLQWSGVEPSPERWILVDRVLQSLIAAELVTATRVPPFTAQLDTRSFFAPRGAHLTKLGFGSSSALTVAFATAIAVWCGRGDLLEDRFEWLQRLRCLHRSLQGGRGSGIDLAAAVMGGVLEFQLDDRGNVAHVAPLRLPEDLYIVPVWTGRSASTGKFLERLERMRSVRRSAVEGAIERLGSTARQAITGTRAQCSDTVIDAVHRFSAALAELSRVADMEILSAEHVALARIAKSCGAAYKPSGAGGGDVGLAMCKEPYIADEVKRAFSEAEYKILEIRPDSLGLTYEPRPAEV